MTQAITSTIDVAGETMREAKNVQSGLKEKVPFLITYLVHFIFRNDCGRDCFLKTHIHLCMIYSRGDHLSTTYTHVLWSTRVRREHLLATKYFLCKCERCADPTELGSHLGTLKCPCEKGVVTADDPLNPETDWSCNFCPGVLSSAEVAQLTERLGEEVDAAMSVADREIMSDLLMR